MELTAEFTTEPFHGEGRPPDHAVRAREAAAEAGLEIDFGPLGTTASGEAEVLLDALPAIATAAFAGGATRFTLQVSTSKAPGKHHPGPHTLDVLIREVEGQLGGPLSGLGRSDKQRAVRLLEERGAFEMRKAVVTVAEALGVTRFTVYNYLNREGD
ncbi:helix-turn-helix domain-containing protein [Amycolatopsis taiwanensis]|uniref:helix-turn-helix domain-containing protein n=1 Tax=Amycolatopsis taiwanensis TaxID=342230 RepID=UPI00047F2DA6|nr:helix-turn-helix domain-containing protein [Amycolatopsis taiwanensis]